VPLSFDGGLVHWKDPFWDFHGFYLRPVQVTPDPLDNLSGADQQLWGLYLTRRLDGMLTFLSKAAVDLYYIGFFDAAATYNSGTGRELQHTLGTRFFGNQPVGPGMLDCGPRRGFQRIRDLNPCMLQRNNCRLTQR
jgi:hypothetical protein